jgi:hypothetical protein
MAAIKRIEIMLLFGRLIVGMLLLSTHQPCRTTDYCTTFKSSQCIEFALQIK